MVRKAGAVQDNSRWHLTDFQRLLVVLAITCAIFLSAISLGSQSIIPLLIAMLLVVGAGLGVFLLGLRLSGRGLVQGHAYVIMVGPPPVGKIVARCDMRLLVDMPGQTQKMVKFRDSSVPVTKWPTVGMTLPVEVSPRNPRQLRVRWENVDPLSVRANPVLDADTELSVPFYTEFSDQEMKALTAGIPGSPTPPRPIEPSAMGARGMAESSDVTESGAAGEPLDDYSGLEDAPTVREPHMILGDEIVVPPHLSADLSPDAGARSAEHDLPTRSIPQPRPAESLAERRGAAPLSAPAMAEPQAEDDMPAMGMMLVVSDLARSLRFYRDLVGFSVIDKGANMAVLGYGGGRILLRQLADMSPVDRRVAHLHISVADVDAAYKDLKDRGVEFVHRPRVTSRGDKLDLWAATFRDPDGHDIALTQWRTREDA
jgi:catechol 2,3-dioxygenase-like lactoylglutathione lyase family enzyme